MAIMSYMQAIAKRLRVALRELWRCSLTIKQSGIGIGRACDVAALSKSLNPQLPTYCQL